MLCISELKVSDYWLENNNETQQLIIENNPIVSRLEDFRDISAFFLNINLFFSINLRTLITPKIDHFQIV